MAKTTSDFLLERMSEWGIRRVFGYPGDGINGILGALGRQEKIEFIQSRHEELSAFMACAHAKFTGEVGVCLATSGPGAIHLLNGLYDAKMDHQPVVAIVGQAKTMSMGGDYQQEVDLISLFKDVANEYVHMATNPVQIRTLIDRAIRIAKAERTVTCVIIPNDVQEEPAETSPPREHGAVYTGVGFTEPRVVPKDEDLRRAAEVLNAGKKVAFMVGAGALGAGDQVVEAAEVLGAGIAKALLGKMAVPDDLPFVTGGAGLLGTKPTWDLMQECDTLFMIGSGFPYSEFLPEEGQARGVQIDIDGRMLSLRYPMEVNLVGDTRETLQALMPYLKRKQDRSWRERIEKNVADWWKTLEKRAMVDADPINPQRVFWELSPRLPNDTIISADSGSVANWYARDIKARPGMMGSLSGTLATMGPAVPYAIAAKFAHPERPVVAFAGDGAMQMNGLNGMISIAKFYPQWKDPRLIVLVLNNGDLNQVTWEQRVLAGDPRYATSQDVPDFPYVRYAESLGLVGIKMARPEDIVPGWEAALKADRPVLVEAITDPNVPPTPPHIKFKQAKNFGKSILRGDRESVGAIRQSLKDMIQSYMPGS